MKLHPGQGKNEHGYPSLQPFLLCVHSLALGYCNFYSYCLSLSVPSRIVITVDRGVVCTVGRGGRLHKLPSDGQRNFLKHVEFLFQKLI